MTGTKEYQGCRDELGGECVDEKQVSEMDQEGHEMCKKECMRGIDVCRKREDILGEMDFGCGSTKMGTICTKELCSRSRPQGKCISPSISQFLS